MNNKGMTLAEIIVSVALISIVLIFLMKLLTTLRYDENFTNYEKNNAINRSEIIKAVQTDLMTYQLFDLKDESNSVSGTGKAVLHFVYADTDRTNRYLVIESAKISYCATTSCNGANDRIWVLNKSKADVTYVTDCIKYDYDITTSSQYYWLKLVVKLDSKGAVDNTIDDIEIFYLGEKGADFNNSHIPQPSDLYLGKHTSGACTN
ncbi:MAG: prepilin-type N-terminal cleavage/methylation domain-containing protein [Bacilli bacterium]|nr:prepilin-type N-terminal cleavage/methylation domain-containing protein [Bacilli bacterium]